MRQDLPDPVAAKVAFHVDIAAVRARTDPGRGNFDARSSWSPKEDDLDEDEGCHGEDQAWPAGMEREVHRRQLMAEEPSTAQAVPTP